MSTRSRRPNKRRRLGAETVFLAVLILVLAASVGRGAETVRLEVLPVPDAMAPSDAEAEVLKPEPGQVLVCGRFDSPDFYVDDVSQLTVIGPEGLPLPLTIDGSSLFVEFDQIVSLRFCFPLAESQVDSADLVLRWGPDVRAGNVRVDALALDAAQPQLYRGFRPEQQADAGPVDSQVASIEVIADSSAEYHFLWYLLPMGVLFVLLTVRKIRARHSNV